MWIGDRYNINVIGFRSDHRSTSNGIGLILDHCKSITQINLTDQIHYFIGEFISILGVIKLDQI